MQEITVPNGLFMIMKHPNDVRFVNFDANLPKNDTSVCHSIASMYTGVIPFG
jgi:hypothetical protein